MNNVETTDRNGDQRGRGQESAPSAPSTSTEGQSKGVGALKPFQEHPAYRIVELVERVTGVGRDSVQAAIVYSLAAGRMGMPIHLDVQTDQLAADLYIVNRILDVTPEKVARVSTHREFRRLERLGFSIDFAGQEEERTSGDETEHGTLYALFIRGVHRTLHREATECTTRVASRHSPPSILRVMDAPNDEVPAPTMLRLQARQAARCFDGFGRAFAGPSSGGDAGENLARAITALPFRPGFECPFADRYRGSVAPVPSLVFERLLGLFTALRQNLGSGPRDRFSTIDDYRAARAFIQSLPLMPNDRSVSAAALGTASALYRAVKKTGNGLSLPGRSGEGENWFTRSDAAKWTGLGYSTARKHLDELENEGVVTSTVHLNNRDHGKQIHFRFVEGRAPPFRWESPFDGLPEIAAPTEG